MTLCSVVLGYRCFGGPCSLHLQTLYPGEVGGSTVGRQANCRNLSFWVVVPCRPEDGGSMDLRNVGILPQHYREDLDMNLHRRERLKTVFSIVHLKSRSVVVRKILQ